MRVMYVASTPEGARTLQIEREVNDLQDRFALASEADPIQFRFHTHIHLNELTEKIRSFEPNVLHFATHGDDDSLIFAHESLGHVKVEGDRLAALLGALAVKPKVIIVNACSSNGIAKSLADAKAASFVIGTDSPITNVGAREMVAALYRRLARGASVGDAFTDAATHLAIVDEARITLHPAGSLEGARLLRLTNPLRILAYFPLVEKWLDRGLKEPSKQFQPGFPDIGFGISGAPEATRQIVFFTDDETVQASNGISIEEARSWLFESQSIDSKIWIEDERKFYGDMNWFVAITTNKGDVASACSTTCKALRRYYFEEQMRGQLPPRISEIIERSIESLFRYRGHLPH